MNKNIETLQSDKVWKLDNQGICIALENELPAASCVFSTWSEAHVERFAKDVNPKWSYKLIGPPDFLNSFGEFFSKNGLKVVKKIERIGGYEVVFEAASRKLRLSVVGESATATTAPPAASPASSTAVSEKVKVLIVDDSSTVRTLLQSILESDSQIEVIGSIDLPSKVEPFISKYKPDVITMDIHMPEMDGVQLLKKIQPKYKIPTIMISSLSEEDGPYVFDALELGAFDYIKKPSFNEIAQVGAFIVERVKLAGRLGARRSRPVAPAAPEPQSKTTGPVPTYDTWPTDKNLLLIGSSTGGTEALKTLFHQFPASIPPVVVVQHIPAVFSKALADRLNTIFKFEVKEAQDGDLVTPNRVLIAPGGKQMGIKQRGSEMRVYITDDNPVNRHKPSVDYLFDSAAKMKNVKSIVGMILTGMGSDGAKGLKKLRDLGAHTIGQDEDSCVVYGMPKAAFDCGAVVEVVPLGKMGRALGKALVQQASKKAS